MLLGRQGEETVTAEELGGHAGTIGYEIVTPDRRPGPREHVG